MIGHREMTMDDYLAIVRRRLWVILVPTVLGPALAFGISLVLPERYVSETLILVEQQKVPESFIKSVVTDELNNRIASIRELVFSRSRLEPIIQKFELYRESQGKVPVEALVDRLRSSIVVTPIKPVVRSRGEEIPGFFITVTANEPRPAQQICAEITSLFIGENLKSREQRAVGTTEFIEKQLREAELKLNEQDKKLAAFKQRYVGQLPGQEQINMNLLMGMNTQLEAVTQVMSRAQQDKTYMESLLAQQIAAWQSTKAGTNPQTLEQQLEKLEGDLLPLESRYTADHPDVIKAKNDIAQLRKKIEQAKSAQPEVPDKENASRLTEPVQIAQLRGQIHQANVIIKEKTREQERLQEQIKIYQARVQLSPVVEQQYKELTRDFETALAFYNDFLNKKNQSEVATDMERRQQGEQFKVMDSANLPEKPSFPNRPLFAGGGLAAGLGIGLGLTMLQELKDKSMRNERDIEVILNLPTLGLIPDVDHTHARARKGLFSRQNSKDDRGRAVRPSLQG